MLLLVSDDRASLYALKMHQLCINLSEVKYGIYGQNGGCTMPAIQVRDFSDEAYDQIKALAKANGRSITQQTKRIVLEYLAVHGQMKEDAAQVEASSATASADAAVTPAVEGRREKTAGRSTAYPNPFRMEDPEEVAARVARRKALFERIASRKYSKEAMEADDVAIIREMRDER